MSVRAKFKVVRFESVHSQRRQRSEDGTTWTQEYEPVEMRTVVLSPVYANNDPNHENSRFWDASPAGEIRLGTINPDAWQQFELGGEYYIDFTRANPPI